MVKKQTKWAGGVLSIFETSDPAFMVECKLDSHMDGEFPWIYEGFHIMDWDGAVDRYHEIEALYAKEIAAFALGVSLS